MAELRATGWQPDPAEDNRLDLPAAQYLAASPPTTGFNLEHLLPPVQDQGGGSSCVLFSFAQVLHAAHVRQGIKEPELCSIQHGWWLCRFEAGTHQHNTGTYTRRAVRLSNERGVCRARHMPYDPGAYAKPPPVMADRMAADQKATWAEKLGRSPFECRRLPPKSVMRAQQTRESCAAGLPVIAGFDISERFRRGELDFSQPIMPPEAGEPMAGGHAMVVYGYDERGNLLVRNSWGTDWGLSGNCIISPQWLNMARDPWTIVSAPYYSDKV
jgi:hypothetical protein